MPMTAYSSNAAINRVATVMIGPIGSIALFWRQPGGEARQENAQGGFDRVRH
jgi:hypothetical protein